MRPFIRSVLYAVSMGSIATAAPAPDNGFNEGTTTISTPKNDTNGDGAKNHTNGDGTHIEGPILPGNTLSEIVTCPPGWTAGLDSSAIPYCFNCGLPDWPWIGCDPVCSNGSCSAYAKGVCGPFSGHWPGTRPHNGCDAVGTDSNIFPGVGKDPGKPVECNTGGKKNEVMAASYVGLQKNQPPRGSWYSNMCGFLLNNCPGGLHAEAVIYAMVGHATGTGENVTNNDFTDHAGGAVKLTAVTTC